MATLKRARLLAAIAVAGFAFAASPALAREVYHPFVKDQFYLARGGTPATFEQVADDPLSVFRSRAAYDAFRAHVSGYLGRNLDDAQFRYLLRSDSIRLVPCTGTIDTAGVTDSGRFGWRVRACYENEMNIELRLDDGRWVIVGSQACWNAIRGELPSLPPPPPTITFAPPPPAPREPVCRMVRAGSRAAMPDVVTIGPFYYRDGCWYDQYGNMIVTPGISVNFGGSSGDTYEMVCE